MGLLRKCWSSFQDIGLFSTVRKAYRRIWYRTRVIVYRKSMAIPEGSPEFPDVIFRPVKPDELSWLCEQLPHLGARAKPLIEEQFQSPGHTIIGVTTGNPPTVVFHLWVSRSPEDRGFQLLGSRIGKNDATTKRGWVPEEYRRHGIATRGILYAEHLARQSGTENIWGLIWSSNMASRKLHERIGYERVGEIRLENRWNRHFARVKCNGDHRWEKIPLPADVWLL